MIDSDLSLKIEKLFAGGKHPHAVLIDGASFEERLEAARFLAKIMVCPNGTDRFCNDCSACRKADEDIHPDIIHITKPEDKKNFTKDTLKTMVENAFLTPNESEIKVYIIHEMQLMSEECQNVLLKILEEPPAYTAFVLTSESANVVIGTVLSRVVRLKLSSDGEEKQYSEKAVEVVRNIAKAFSTSYEFDMIAATSPLDGDKSLTAEVLSLLCLFFRDCIALKYQGEVLFEELKEETQRVAFASATERLFESYRDMNELARSTEGNPNYTLLTAVLCLKLKK